MFATYLSKWQGIPGAALPPDSLPAKQSFWDTPGITQSGQTGSGRVKAGCLSEIAVSGGLSSSQRGLVTGASASCGLRLDEAIRVAVALRLGLDLGAPAHTPLWSVGGCSRPTWPCLQTSSEQDSQTSATERSGDSSPGVGGHTCNEGTSRPNTSRWYKRPDGTTQIPWCSKKLLVYGTSQL